MCPSFNDLQGPWPGQEPVCASNGFTYGHVHQVRCLRDLQPGWNSLHGINGKFSKFKLSLIHCRYKNITRGWMYVA